MINRYGQIEVPVGCTFNDGENTYRAITPHDCAVCHFNHGSYGRSSCKFLSCLAVERLDGNGVHFIREGGEK